MLFTRGQSGYKIRAIADSRGLSASAKSGVQADSPPERKSGTPFSTPSGKLNVQNVDLEIPSHLAEGFRLQSLYTVLNNVEY
jgi:hypothetical protein